MAQPQPEERKTFDEVLNLVDKLSPDEQEQLRLRLNSKSWGDEWRQLVQDVEKDNKRLSPLTDDEISAEMKAIRQEIRAERAQGSN